MRVSIMQPYFFPYIGYFQLIANSDVFVIYDEIKYTKKGWINRNRFLNNGSATYFTLPLKKDSDFLYVSDRFLSEDWEIEKQKILNKTKGAYSKAPHFKETFTLFEKCLSFENTNLFEFIFNAVKNICDYLEINTPIQISSELQISNDFKSAEKVKAICRTLKATTYINPVGGIELYDKDDFLNDNLELVFLKAKNVKYPQFENEFEPFLSILDVLMFNDLNKVKEMIHNEFEIL
jgi:hypothetical protein